MSRVAVANRIVQSGRVSSYNANDVPGLAAWFRGDQIVLDPSGRVLIWPDLSGNGLHADNIATPACRPFFQKQNTFFGDRPTPAFTRAQATYLYNTTSLVPVNSARTLIIVHRRTQVTGAEYGGCLFGFRYNAVGSSYSGSYYTFNWTNAEFALYDEASGVQSWTATPYVNEQPAITTLALPTNPAGQGATIHRVNGVDVPTASGAGFAAEYSLDPGFTIGCRSAAGQTFQGEIAEIAVYNRLLSIPEIQVVENSLAQRYQIPSFNANNLSGLATWLRADQVATDTSGGVQVWPDRSGNGRDALQPTPGNRPTVNYSQFGGRPSLYLNPAFSQYLVRNGPVVAAQPMTCVSVFRVNDVSSARVVYAGLSGAQLAASGASQIQPYAGTSVNENTATLNTNLITSEVYNGASSIQRVNGVTLTTGNPGALAQQNSLFIGANSSPSYFMSGFIAEIIVYSRALAINELQALERSLGRRYQITVA